MPRQAMDYSKNIIYKIVCNDLNITETYVGHTTNIVKRRCQHKCGCNNENDKSYNFKIYKTIRDNGGWNNWSMVLICDFPCKNDEEARAEERRYYELLNASLNTVNPCRNKKEYRDANKDIISEYKKEYYEANKDTILEKQKEYREANRDTILEKQKEYYEANKDIISEKMKEYRDANKDIILEKQKEYYEANKDTLLEYKKEYYEANKDTILEKQKEYYEANKSIIKEKSKIKYTCCCGSMVTKSSKSQHEKSQKHKDHVINTQTY
jgi:hypothetical protein